MTSSDSSIMLDLLSICKGKDWFHSVNYDEFGRIVVYVNYMSEKNLTAVPNKIEDKQILMHFAKNLLAKSSDFMNDPKPFSKPLDKIAAPAIDDLELDEEYVEDKNLLYLLEELDKLEDLCNNNILQDIFYETHDKKNAVTNLSAKFPEVRERLEKLYNEYGFDVVYGELEINL